VVALMALGCGCYGVIQACIFGTNDDARKYGGNW
jgi:hypothetical protein